jgi:hypothetical protein
MGVDQTFFHCGPSSAAPRLWRLSDLYSAEHAGDGSPRVLTWRIGNPSRLGGKTGFPTITEPLVDHDNS